MHTQIKLKFDTHKGIIKAHFWLESNKDLQTIFCVEKVEGLSHLQGILLEGIS